MKTIPLRGQLIDDLRAATRVSGGTGTWVLVGSANWVCAVTSLVGFPGVRFLLSGVPFELVTEVLDAAVTAASYDVRGMVIGLEQETWERARLRFPILRLGSLTVFEHPEHDPALAD